ncbi:C-GCAxxG-C-C family protein [Flavonifractor plautii]|nr:C-GCAxxG-C-C family protein [Flavonifractor plautii]
MAEMKLYELVNHYHIGTELTCAEAMFMACNEYYHLNLSEETRKMFSVMGLGMQTEQSCCGAFTVAVGIIGLMTAKEGQTDVNNMEGYRMIAELTDFMLGFYGTLHCVELQRLEIVGYENPCHAIVEALAKNWRSCWLAAASYARQMQDRLAPDLWQKKQAIVEEARRAVTEQY